MSLSNRSINSIFWNVAVSPIQIGLLFVRSVLLARLLPVEVFGVYAFAGSIVTLSSFIPKFGMGDAFLHRTKETEDENHAAATHFTLKLIFTLIWSTALISASLLFAEGDVKIALVWMTLFFTGLELCQTPELILIRRVVHRRLALIQVLNALLTTVVAVTLAWSGVRLWALLATDLVTLSLTVFILYIYHPVWKPRLSWSTSEVIYFLKFGYKSLLANILQKALDQVDDIWTGFSLGATSLGFYSRAYAFATYPRKILAAPINDVTRGTYAELKEKRLLLSQAFFRTNALLVRTGFFLSGLLALVAPEFITILIGEKWLPMLSAFRLMLVYTLFDPLKITIAYVFIAVGKPEKVVQARAIQFLVLLIGLVTLGSRFDIAGVALAVDLMLLVGIGLLLWQVRAHVDFSFKRMFLVPGIALITGLGVAILFLSIPGIVLSDWLSGVLKIVIFSTFFLVILYLSEREQLFIMAQFLLNRLPGRYKLVRNFVNKHINTEQTSGNE